MKRQRYNHLKVACVEKWSLDRFAFRNSNVSLRSKLKHSIKLRSTDENEDLECE